MLTVCTHDAGVYDPLHDGSAHLSRLRDPPVAVEARHVKRDHTDDGEPQEEDVTRLPVLTTEGKASGKRKRAAGGGCNASPSSDNRGKSVWEEEESRRRRM